MNFQNIHYAAKSANPDLCSEKMVLRKDSPSKDMMGDKNFSNLSFKNFVSFREWLGLQVNNCEKEVASLLRKLEAKKGCKVVTSSTKGRPFSTSCVERELWKLFN